MFMKARGNIPNDHRVIFSLLESGIKGEHLSYCCDFLVANGNNQGDVPILREFGNAIKDQISQKLFLEFLKANGN